MKKIILVGIIALFSIYPAYSQFTFTVNPGLGIYGASVGYQFGNLVPFVGFQFLSASTSVDYKSMAYMDSLQIEPHKEDVALNIYMPFIGAKYFLGQFGKVKPYATAILYKPFLSVSNKTNGSSQPEVDDFIDNLSLFGIEAGFGTEYFLDKNFSIGGEFGLRFIFTSTKDTYQTSYWDNVKNEDVDYTKIYNYSLFLNYTYARANLCYYFH